MDNVVVDQQGEGARRHLLQVKNCVYIDAQCTQMSQLENTRLHYVALALWQCSCSAAAS